MRSPISARAGNLDDDGFSDDEHREEDDYEDDDDEDDDEDDEDEEDEDEEDEEEEEEEEEEVGGGETSLDDRPTIRDIERMKSASGSSSLTISPKAL